MLRRLGAGGINTAGSASLGRRLNRDATRRLYDINKTLLYSHMGYQPLQSTHPVIPITPSEKNAELQKELPPPLQAAQRLLNVDIIEKNKLSSGVSYDPIPRQLKIQLKQVSDPHLKLRELFNFNESFRIDPGFVEGFLKDQFKRESLHDVYALDIDDESLVKLGRLYTSTKAFDKIADLYRYLQATGDIALLKSTNDTIFKALKEDHDVELGFFNIMKQLYLLDTSMQNFRQSYLFIGQGGSFKERGIQCSFIELIQSIQLEIVVQSTDNVLRLPHNYYETNLTFVNAALVTKLIDVGEIQRGFELLKDKLNSVQGMLARIIDAGVGNRIFEDNLLGYLKPSMGLTARDAHKWSKLSHGILLATLQTLKDSVSLPVFLNAYTKESLEYKDRFTTIIQLLQSHIHHIDEIDPAIILNVILKNNDPKFHQLIMSSLDPTVRSSVLDTLIHRITCHKMKLEQRVLKMKKILKNVQLEDKHVLTLAPFLNKLTAEDVIDLFNRIKGPTEEGIVHSMYRITEKRTQLELATALFRKGHFKDSDPFVHFISNFTTEEITGLLTSVQDQKSRFKFLHPSIISKLLSDNQYSKAYQIQSTIAHSTSESLLNEYRLFHLQEELTNIITTDPIELLRLQTLQCLHSNEEVAFNRLFKDQLKLLFTSSRVNKAQLAEALLTHVVRNLRIHTKNHEIIKTERLKWCVEICLKNAIPKERITELIQGH